MKIHKKLPFLFYIATIVLLLLYSFTQIDLSLTLSRYPLLHELVKSFQYIGYFNRPLSTGLFLLLLGILFSFYLFFLRRAVQKKLHAKDIWIVIGATSIILFFSYNAFSYDLFNYIFDAKIFTHYGQNPYEHKALDYPRDPMLSFMRWVHRNYPYGPVWLGITIPLSYAGLQFFIPTVLLFKSIIVLAYLGTTLLLGRIIRKLYPEHELTGIIFFALNPLVIIEGLISAHNDMVMMFFAVAAFYFIIEKKYIRSLLFLLLSIGIKFATIFLLPVYLAIILWHIRKKNIPWEKIFLASTLCMSISIIYASVTKELQPWYLLWVLPFATILVQKQWVKILSIIVSIGVLLHYVPFLHEGNWDAPIPLIKSWVTGLSLVLAAVIILPFFRKRKQTRV